MKKLLLIVMVAAHFVAFGQNKKNLFLHHLKKLPNKKCKNLLTEGFLKII